MDMRYYLFESPSMGILIAVVVEFLLVMTWAIFRERFKKLLLLIGPGLAGLFVLFGTVVGIVGAAAGIGLGWLIIDNINAIEQAIASVFGIKLWKASTYMFTQIPNTMHWGSVLWITAAGIIAAAVGSLIPAVAAARVKPVETLQYE